MDIKKAFDSVHDRESLWYIKSIYGIPQKIINIIMDTYDVFRCAIIHDGKLSDWFEITSGVKQGCIIYSFLYFVMKKATTDNHGILWGLTNF